MELKKIIEFDKKLPFEYSLMPLSVEGDKWVLFNTITGVEILTSERATEEELKKFVKEHSYYDFMDIARVEILVINTLGLILSLANTIFIHSALISGIVFGMILVLIPLLITLLVVSEKNFNTDSLILKEQEEEIKKTLEKLNEAVELMDKIDKAETKKKTTKGKKVAKTNTKTEKSGTKTAKKTAKTKGEEKKD